MTGSGAFLKSDAMTIGIGVTELTGPSLPGLLAAAGLDYALFDMEHSSLTLRELAAFVVGCRAVGLPVLVRPTDLAPATIGRLLDLGAEGILAQQVRSAPDVAAVVRAAKYPPLGIRGDDGRISSAGAGARVTAEEANGRMAVMAIIETPEAVEDIDAICETPGLDLAWLGPSDLSLALGVPAEFEGETYRSAHERVLAACRSRGLRYAIGGPATPAEVLEHLELGCSTVLLADELTQLKRALVECVNAVRASRQSRGG